MVSKMFENSIKTKGCYLGVDYGDVRTGLAKTDATRFLAASIGNIQPGGMRHTAIAVAEEARKIDAKKIVVGLPKNMNGTEGDRAEKVRAFVSLLKEETDIPIDMIDERLSTVEAYNYLNETRTKSKKRRSVIDGLSAQIILQNYIDKEKNYIDK